MKSNNFIKLINSLTKKDFLIDSNDDEIQLNKEYSIYRILPLTQRKVHFKWVTPKSDDKILRSFITAYCSKYKEPDPRAYDYSARTYGERALWVNKTEMEREYAYWHHSSNMFDKKQLYEQIETNFNSLEFEQTLCKYGFYPTEYGVGIFVLFAGNRELEAVRKMKHFLSTNSIPYTNEFSDARWVYRFKLNLNKDSHNSILNKFNS